MYSAATTLNSDLSPSQRQLVQLMQSINFGRIQNLRIRGGEPVLSPAPTTVRDIKFGGDNEPRAELGSPRFVLKAQVVELFEHLRRMDNGVVSSLTVRHGLPFNMSVETAV